MKMVHLLASTEKTEILNNLQLLLPSSKIPICFKVSLYTRSFLTYCIFIDFTLIYHFGKNSRKCMRSTWIGHVEQMRPTFISKREHYCLRYVLFWIWMWGSFVQRALFHSTLLRHPTVKALPVKFDPHSWDVQEWPTKCQLKKLTRRMWSEHCNP